MATGRPPFAGETVAVIFDGILRERPVPPSKLNPEVPPELERIIGKTLEKDREERYQTARDLLVDLKRLRRQLLSGLTGESAPPVTTSRPRVRGRRLLLGLGILAAAALFAIVGVLLSPPAPSEPKILRFNKITNTPGEKSCPLSAGKMVYFLQSPESGPGTLMELSTAGGDPITIPHPLGAIDLTDLAPDGSELLVLQVREGQEESALWLLPVPSGSPRRVGNVVAHDASFSRDVTKVAYANGNSIYEARPLSMLL